MMMEALLMLVVLQVVLDTSCVLVLHIRCVPKGFLRVSTGIHAHDCLEPLCPIRHVVETIHLVR